MNTQPPRKRAKREIDPSRSLYDAVRVGNEEWGQKFITMKADLNEIGGKWIHRRTPLCKAVIKGNQRIAALLLGAGADVNKETELGTPLSRVALRGDIEMTALLLKHHADPNPKIVCGAMFCAIDRRHEGIVRMLLVAGSNLNAIIEPEGCTPLHKAALIDNKK